MLKKTCLYFILFIIPIFSLSQTMAHLETKRLTDILSIETQKFIINSDTSITQEQVEYYDGRGNLVYFFEYDNDTGQTKHVMMQNDLPFKFYYEYNDGKRDSYFSEKQLNDSTYIMEYFLQDTVVSTIIFLDSSTVLILPDSTIKEIKYDNQHNFKEIKYTKKDGEIDVIFKYEILESDKKGNWTKRFETIISNRSSHTFLSERKIKYFDDYEITSYFEIEIDTFKLDGRLIKNPEILKPNLNDKLIDSDLEEEFINQKFIYESVQRLFHVKYLSDKYFLNFSTNKLGIDEVLKLRLLYYFTTVVYDIKNERHFKGRTKSKRWFDKTESYKRLEQMESPPLPTENWIQINGYSCREYVKTNTIGKADKFFVTEKLPFINYCDFTFNLPGFVMKSERYIPKFGETSIVVDVVKCKYPFHFLENLKELNEKYGTEIMYLQKR